MKVPKVLVYTDLDAKSAETTKEWIALKLGVQTEYVTTHKIDEFNGPIPEDVDLAVCVINTPNKGVGPFLPSPAQADAIKAQPDKIFMMGRSVGDKDTSIAIRTLEVKIKGKDSKIDIKWHYSFVDPRNLNFFAETPSTHECQASGDLSMLGKWNGNLTNKMKLMLTASIAKKKLKTAVERPESVKDAPAEKPAAGEGPESDKGIPREKPDGESTPKSSISVRDRDTADGAPITSASSTSEEKKHGWQRPAAIAVFGVGSVIIGGGSAAGLAQIEGLTSIMGSSGMSSGAIDATFSVGGTVIAVVVFSLSYAAINKFMTPKNEGVVRGG